MKIRASRRHLGDALTWACSAISKQPVAPALAGIRLTASEGELTLRAFNYDVSHTIALEVDEIESGDCLVAGHFLREIVNAIQGVEVELVLDGRTLGITSGRSAYGIRTLPLEDYPKLPDLPPVVGTLDADLLAGMVGTVAHAAGRDLLVPILTAVHVAGTTDALRVETTDRFRAARVERTWRGKDFTADVPATQLVASLKGMAGPLDVGADTGSFGITDGTRTVTVRTFTDGFPKMDRLFAIEGGVTAQVDSGDLAAAIKRAVMAAGEHEIVNLTISADEIAVTADSEVGDGCEYVGCTADGETEVIFNGVLLSAALAATSGTVRARFPGASKPATIHPLDDERVGLLVMPRRNT